MELIQAASSPHIIRAIKQLRITWAGHVETRNTYKIFVGKCGRKRSVKSLKR